MNIIDTAIADIKIIEPRVFGDARGFFFESFNERVFTEKLSAFSNVAPAFVQDNHSRSSRGVLRGLHYQLQSAQGKLVRAVMGEIFDVVVDIRKHSPTFGQHVAVRLSAENKRMLWVPIGFAHGFLTVSDVAEVLYKTTNYYAPQHERSLLWNDLALKIEWPLVESGPPQLKPADMNGKPLSDAELFV